MNLQDLVRTPEFFYDPVHVYSLPRNERTIEELTAHGILLGSNVEGFLKVATLIDGSTVDFLFGAKSVTRSFSRARANEVKRFLRSLGSREQDEVARFYFNVYTSLSNYYVSRGHACGCMWETQLRATFRDDVQRAFSVLAKNLRTSDWEGEDQ